MKHPIPISVLDQHLVALGKTGSGKSSALRVLVEMLLDAGKRVCIIDKKGDWYGIKLGADGKSAGYPLMAFGDFKNPQATDIHINETHGTEIAKLILSGNRPCLIGFKGWMPGKLHKFWIDFASTVYNENKEPLWLVISEAHNFSPKGKVLSPVVGECIYWTNLIATEGRGIGLRLMIDSQRPAKVHNDLLSSCETLIAMRVTLPADKDALSEWLREYADDNARGKMVLDGVSKMKTGEAFVWSPEAEVFEQMKFPMFKTFDSFASPKEGVQRTLKGWASVNLDEVKQRLSAVIEETKANDPAELKKKIRELETQIKRFKMTPVQVPIDESVVARAVDKATKELQQQYAGTIKKFQQAFHEQHLLMVRAANMLNTAQIDMPEVKIEVPSAKVFVYQRSVVKPEVPTNKKYFKENVVDQNNENGTKLPIGEEAVLKAVAQDVEPTERDTISVLTGYKRSSRDAYIARLQQKQYIEVGGGGFIVTDDGLNALGTTFEPLPTGQELINYWMQKLPDGERAIFAQLVEAYPNSLSRDTLGESTNYKRSSRDAYIARLKARRLVESVGAGIKASERLFL